MREGPVECKDCRFWLQKLEEDPKLESMMSDYGLCLQFRSVNWGMHMYRSGSCEYGELKKKGIRAD
jgi:hypothetical protein